VTKAVHPHHRLLLLNHLSEAEIELRVAAQYECLQATPAHDSVRAALAQVKEAREWISTKLAVEVSGPKPVLTARQTHQAIQRRMARLAP
jgi:hypothetical protein